MVHLDDLDRLEVGGGLSGKAHEQHGAQCEVRCDDDADLRTLHEHGPHLIEPRVVESGRADDRVDALLDAVAQSAHDGIGGGEVDGHLDAGSLEPGERIAEVERRSEVEVPGGIHGPDDLRSHAPGGTDDSDLDHPISLVVPGHPSEGATRGPALHDVPMRRSRLALVPLLATAASATLTAGLLSAVAPAANAAPGVAPARSTVPLPTITQIPGDTIFTGAQQDLEALDYIEEEYLVGVTQPQVYRYVGKTVRTLVKPAPAVKGGYKSRIIVRAPGDPADFNGRVLVEMMNTTTLVDLDVAWQQAHQYLIREGWAYVGITVQQTGINALKQFKRQPTRYTGLGLNLMTPTAAKDTANGSRDPSIAWDLTSQVGALIGQGAATSPLADYDVESLYLTGQSQMAGYATTYVNAIHPRHRIYDGFLVAYRGTGATNLQYAKPVSGAVPSTSASVSQRTLRARGGAPVILLQSESDPLRLPPAADIPDVSASLWRADADTPDDRFRLWEVAGSSHNDRWGAEQALGVLSRDFNLPFAPVCPWTAPAGVNDFPMRFAWHRALDGLAAWHETGSAPPSAPRLERDTAGVVQRDGQGNALGGIRMPRIEVPVASYAPTTPGPLFCPLTGTQTPFSADELASRYPTTDAYVAQVQAKVAESIAAGFLLTEDGAALVESARRGPAAEAETIQRY